MPQIFFPKAQIETVKVAQRKRAVRQSDIVLVGLAIVVVVMFVVMAVRFVRLNTGTRGRMRTEVGIEIDEDEVLAVGSVSGVGDSNNVGDSDVEGSDEGAEIKVPELGGTGSVYGAVPVPTGTRPTGQVAVKPNSGEGSGNLGSSSNGTSETGSDKTDGGSPNGGSSNGNSSGVTGGNWTADPGEDKKPTDDKKPSTTVHNGSVIWGVLGEGLTTDWFGGDDEADEGGEEGGGGGENGEDGNGGIEGENGGGEDGNGGTGDKEPSGTDGSEGGVA